MEGMKALDDCFANSQRDMAKGYGPASKNWHRASSDRCVVAAVQRAVESDSHGKEEGSAAAARPKTRSSRVAHATAATAVSTSASPPTVGMAYALGVAHLLKQRGDNRNLGKALKDMKPTHLAQFAVELQGLMRKVSQSKGNARC